MMFNKIIQGDCLETLRTLPDGVANTCVTSPPYFGLRDYGHEGQIGLEETPEAYVQKLVDVFREVKRVLKDDGTLWLNLGDSYAGGGGGNYNKTGVSFAGGQHITNVRNKSTWLNNAQLKPKDLIGIPWMVAFALRADGWFLRQDIIWHKPNPMPESVTDRCTKAHEYIFLLSKSAKYYYDADAIKQPMQIESFAQVGKSFVGGKKHKNLIYKGQSIHSFHKTRNENGKEWQSDNGLANKRSVWTVTTKPFREAHFATFPEDLIVDCIKAGCPEDGIVLDPFMGAGTTAVVARKLNRNYIGCELNPEYITIAEQRIQKQIGLFL